MVRNEQVSRRLTALVVSTTAIVSFMTILEIPNCPIPETQKSVAKGFIHVPRSKTEGPREYIVTKYRGLGACESHG